MSPAERRRENRFLLFILILAVLTVVRLWDTFGVISLPGPFGDAFWRKLTGAG